MAHRCRWAVDWAQRKFCPLWKYQFHSDMVPFLFWNKTREKLQLPHFPYTRQTHSISVRGQASFVTWVSRTTFSVYLNLILKSVLLENPWLGVPSFGKDSSSMNSMVGSFCPSDELLTSTRHSTISKLANVKFPEIWDSWAVVLSLPSTTRGAASNLKMRKIQVFQNSILPFFQESKTTKPYMTKLTSFDEHFRGLFKVFVPVPTAREDPQFLEKFLSRRLHLFSAGSR